MSIRSSNPAQSRISSVVQRHPLACFFVLTYVAAWCLWAPLIILRDALHPAVAFILVLLGSLVPSTIAIVLVAIVHGNRGVRSLLGRLVKWRVGFRWYAVVLILPLLAPLGLGVSILLGGRAPTVDSSVIAVLVGFVFSIFPGSALGEELGWRGFALPHLQDGHSALAAALILGPIWGSWHLPLFLIGNESRPLVLFPAFAFFSIYKFIVFLLLAPVWFLVVPHPRAVAPGNPIALRTRFLLAAPPSLFRVLSRLSPDTAVRSDRLACCSGALELGR